MLWLRPKTHLMHEISDLDLNSICLLGLFIDIRYLCFDIIRIFIYIDDVIVQGEIPEIVSYFGIGYVIPSTPGEVQHDVLIDFIHSVFCGCERVFVRKYN